MFVTPANPPPTPKAIDPQEEDRFLQEFFEEIAARASTTVVEEK